MCPNCGAPLASPTPTFEPPPAYTPPPAEVSYAALPSSSGLAKASLILGIAALALVIIGFVVMMIMVGSIMDMSYSQTQRYAEENMGLFLCIGGAFILSPIAGLVGLILGIVGMNQEKNQPTQSGRTHSIVGIVLSALPLLCCVGLFVLGLIGSAAGA